MFESILDYLSLLKASPRFEDCIQMIRAMPPHPPAPRLILAQIRFDAYHTYSDEVHQAIQHIVLSSELHAIDTHYHSTISCKHAKG